MLEEKLNGKKLILGSQSPRRKQLLAALDLKFDVVVRPVDESYPSHLNPAAVAEHIAKSKAKAFVHDVKPDQIIITGDTVVVYEDQILGKPQSKEEAFTMLKGLSGKRHEVISSLAVLNAEGLSITSDTARVFFKYFTSEELDYYVQHYQPYDKAGGYGIQEWLGHVGLMKLEGSYNTVMGLPTHLLYKMLSDLLEGSSRTKI